MTGKLYLIPSLLGENPANSVIPDGTKNILEVIDIFIAEDIRTARRMLKKMGISKPIDSLTFVVFNEHTPPSEASQLLQPVFTGKNIGIISEAGVPGIADPGSDIVLLAHEKNIPVIPLTGPSSILLAMMASGLNGQNFAFIGYIPVKKDERIQYLKKLEKKSETEKQSQIFIEAPYRNQHLLQDIIENCNLNTYLCVACDITLESEFIQTRTIKEWKKKIPEINKRPSIFIIHKF